MMEASDYRLLVDPIVTAYFRNSPHSRVWMYPPRRLLLERAGAVNAVYFSHEHEDHFHIESIHALDRETVIYLSANISEPAERILGEMGFRKVRRLFAMDQVALGTEMTLTVFPPPAAPVERWVLQPFIKGRSYEDSFFNLVDCPASPEFLDTLTRAKVSLLGLVCMANNMQISRSSGPHYDLRPRREVLGMNIEPARVLSSHLKCGPMPPLRFFAVVGGGFIEGTAPFGTFKCASQTRLAELLSEYSHGKATIFGPKPGDAIELSDAAGTVTPAQENRIVAPSPEGQAAFEAAEAQAVEYVPSRNYEPVTGRTRLRAGEKEAIEGGLADLAVKLAAHPMHVEMTQQAFARSTDGRLLPYAEGRLLLALRNGAPDDPRSALAYEYQPIRRAFVPLPALPRGDPWELYPFGFECWASDLLALLEGELSIYELIKHRYRYWTAEVTYTGRHNFALTLEHLFAPEVSPEATYRLYRRAYERCVSTAEQK